MSPVSLPSPSATAPAHGAAEGATVGGKASPVTIARWGALHSEPVPHYRAAAESCQRAQDAVRRAP